jgi:prepilin-type N-terminal cleavage/methylation domain-containing protein
MRKGFTLVELMVAMAIFSLLAGSAYFALGSGLRSWGKAAEEAEQKQIYTLMLERICRDVRASSGVLAGSDSNELIMLVASEEVRYAWEKGKVKIEKGKSAAFLTSEGEIGKLEFVYPAKGRVRIIIDGKSSCVANRN